MIRSLIYILTLMLLVQTAQANPFSMFNKPVSIGSWKASCTDAYVTNPARGYAKGYCHGVMLAYMNKLDEWCVPGGVSWGEVEDYVALTVAEANIDPLSQQDIGEWLSGAIQTKWPCL